jgi:hypothetical protein
MPHVHLRLISSTFVSSDPTLNIQTSTKCVLLCDVIEIMKWLESHKMLWAFHCGILQSVSRIVRLDPGCATVFTQFSQSLALNFNIISCVTVLYPVFTICIFGTWRPFLKYLHALVCNCLDRFCPWTIRHLKRSNIGILFTCIDRIQLKLIWWRGMNFHDMKCNR